jgi:S-(hydroxymethyl)glutathione dehydrogenase/alcohol dehydrogenase
MADSVILTVGVLTGSLFGEVADLVGKGGTICSTSVARFDDDTIRGVPISAFMLSAKNIAGNVFGRANPLWDMPRMFQLYRRGELLLDEMITRRYSLDEINRGYDDLHAGQNVRGVIVY